jgi:hypothetical protein
MTTIALHAAPPRGTVFREQLRSVFLSLRNETLAYLGTLLLFAALAAYAAFKAGSDPREGMNFSYDVHATIPIALVALFVPFSVWRTEDPSRRAYLWSMPVARGASTLMKVVSGWIWVMGAVAAYLVWIVLVGLMIAAIRAPMGAMHFAPAWEWLVPFTATTVTYLLVSIAVIASNHPWRWVAGIALGYLVLIAFLSLVELRTAAQWLDKLFVGWYGLRAAMFGAIKDLEWPSVDRWLGATLIWGAIAIAGVLAAAFRRPE